MDPIQAILIFWSVLGVILVYMFREPESKEQALVQVVVSGPIGWTLFIVLSVVHFFKREEEK